MRVNTFRHAHARHRQQGLTLLESLVAIVVLALGVLGMLGVQMRTLAETQTGVRRAQAVRLIEDLSERIKSNPRGLDQLDDYIADWDATVAAATDCSSAACTPAQLAAWDLKAWRDSVAETLPLGQATTFASSDTDEDGARRLLGVMVGWRVNERETEADSTYTTSFSVDTTTQTCPQGLICHLVYIQP